MKVLWLTNFILPSIAAKLELPASVKEGWVVGMSEALKARKSENDIELAIASPVPANIEEGAVGIFDGVRFYGFHELQPCHIYDPGKEKVFFQIAEDFKPDVIHIFGTEYPHTRAMVEGIYKYGNRANGLSSYRILIGLQGVMYEITEHYLDGVPADVAKKKTFRDMVKRDSIADQVMKCKLRTVNELAALSYVGHVTGRTPFDEAYAKKNAFLAKYHFMNETLRPGFYEGTYDPAKANPHEIFVSQGDYPLKGMHFLIKALPKILSKYPDTRVYVAGDSITREGSFKEKLKLPQYGKYLLELEKEVEKETGKPCPVEFLGRLPFEEMKARYLRAGLYICCSTVENSPNSLGEAMLLGVPAIAARVGGIPGIMEDGVEGILYEPNDPDSLAEAVDKIWSDEDLRGKLTQNARKRALTDHDPEKNYKRLLEIYDEIAADDRYPDKDDKKEE